MIRSGNRRAALKAKRREELALVGLVMRDRKKTIDRVLDGLSLHQREFRRDALQRVRP